MMEEEFKQLEKLFGKKDFKEMLNNEDLMEVFLNSFTKADFFISKVIPSYTLKECLEKVDDDILKVVYFNYKYILRNGKVKKNDLTREEIIDLFLKDIPKLFEEFVEQMDSRDVEVIKDALKHGGKTKKKCNTLLECCFQYGFLENGKEIYVIPKELLTLYQELGNSEVVQKNVEDKVILYLNAYFILYGIIPKEEFMDIILNYYYLNVTEDEVEKILEKNNIYLSENNYYCLEDTFGKGDIEELLDLFEDVSYLRLDDMSLMSYLKEFGSFYESVTNLLKDQDSDGIISVFSTLLLFPSTKEEIVDELKEYCSFNKSKEKKLNQILEEILPKLRFWGYKGRTMHEFSLLCIKDAFVLEKKPKKTDVISCLESLSDDAYTQVFTTYCEEGEKIDVLGKRIIESFETLLEDIDDDHLDILKSCDCEEYVEDDEGNFVSDGYIFLYEEGGVIYSFLPDELKKLVDDMDYEYNQDDSESMVENYVDVYLMMNGVIERKRLFEMLRDHHSLDISLGELDRIVNDCGGSILKNKYYTLLDEDDEILDYLLKEKEKLNDYKIFEFGVDTKDEEFLEEVDDYLEFETSLSKEEQDKLNVMLTSLIKLNIYQDSYLKEVVKEEGISLSKSELERLCKIAKRYKNEVSLWVYNGYSNNEYRQLYQSSRDDKVGRNDPCPCGSGRKFKQCCGK